MPGILTLANDSPKKTVVVALALCLVCSIVVAGAAVLLKPMQLTNQAIDRKKNIVEVAGLLEEGKSVDEIYEQYIEPRIVELATGEYTDRFDPETYDLRKAARDPELGVAVPPDLDMANIKVKARYAPVYLVKQDDQIKTIILPVHGYGLWSTMYGFLALESDAKTIVGLKFYEHAETPGLGGEIDNAGWLARWEGKVVYDEQGRPRIQVVKGEVAPDRPEAEHRVQGISGATLTSRGVMYLLQYWLSDQAFGPYLARFREQQQAQRG